MKILTVSDEECAALWDNYVPGRLKEYDLILSCGDLSARYLSFLVTMARCPLLYVQIHFRLGGRVPVGYHPDAVRQQVGLRRSLDTGPPQLDLRSWVGHLRPQRKGIDGCGNAEDRVGRDIADAVVLGHGARNGAGDELRLVDTPVIGADAGIRLIDGAVEEAHLGILHRGLQRGAA